MTKKPVRNYLKILNEFINLQTPFDCELIGTIIYNDYGYPYLYLHTHSKLAKWNVVINAGAHGTESIGVKIILRFLQEFNKELSNKYNFEIFPIVNPFGYRYDCRKNGFNQYGNTGFIQKLENHLTPEAKLIKEYLPQKIDLFLDLHADEKDGFYIYERKRPNITSLALKGLQEIKQQKFPILKCDTVYKEKCIEGVIISPERDGSMDNSMFNRGAIYSLCLEIPTKIPEDQQMVGCLLLLESILKNFKKE